MDFQDLAVVPWFEAMTVLVIERLKPIALINRGEFSSKQNKTKKKWSKKKGKKKKTPKELREREKHKIKNYKMMKNSEWQWGQQIRRRIELSKLN